MKHNYNRIAGMGYINISMYRFMFHYLYRPYITYLHWLDVKPLSLTYSYLSKGQQQNKENSLKDTLYYPN